MPNSSRKWLRRLPRPWSLLSKARQAIRPVVADPPDDATYWLDLPAGIVLWLGHESYSMKRGRPPSSALPRKVNLHFIGARLVCSL
jgi:hypothetical protein